MYSTHVLIYHINIYIERERYVYTYIHTCNYVCMHVCMYVCVCVYIHMYTYIHTFICGLSGSRGVRADVFCSSVSLSCTAHCIMSHDHLERRVCGATRACTERRQGRAGCLALVGHNS